VSGAAGRPVTPASDPVAPAIDVVAYDPTWPARFEAIRDRLAAALDEVAVAIEHVGSTAVPGLAAKPIIDIDVIVAERAAVPVAIAILEQLGYAHLGELGVRDREAFRRPPDTARHNLYVCLAGGEGLRNHLALRDHLRRHPEARAAYGALKQRLAGETSDIEAYVAAKTDLIVAILRAEGIDEPTLASIRAANAPP
jgi:GrpB-like predicted nucleotidyltransferase (UPF0157 family)